MSLRTIVFVALLASSFAWSQTQNTAATTAGAKHDVAGGVDGKIQIPNRSATSLFQGQQGKQKTEIHFDPATGMVTLKPTYRGSPFWRPKSIPKVGSVEPLASASR